MLEVPDPEYLAFARGQAAGSSPTYERLAYAVASDPQAQQALASVPVAKRQPNLLFGTGRLLGAPVDDPTAFLTWLAGNWTRVRAELLTRSTQTNEAGRCATLVPALNLLPGPLALLEVGASAGLCLYPDRYRYDWGDGVVGDGPGPVLACTWSGDAPTPTAVPEVVWRAGLDLHPLDLTDPEDLGWLECLVWPEHDERRRRLQAAAGLVVADPPLLVTGDLVDDLPRLASLAPAGATLVVMHSAVLAYVDAQTRARFVEVVRSLGAHWLANEHPSLIDLLVAAPEPPDVVGPQPFLTALDGTPIGWSGPHGQSYRALT
ncbi:DUF2332 domain-containing protein [Phycicoccus sp. Root563]|uniref:DUF2332 domain-containing protein n=1 Tax=Phycicoccus sp. Root563 TaxID=1736562 RepID=UPI001F3C9072|nr:DUF2332 domain-containing protein [Phycicoccus sp. Root563]